MKASPWHNDVPEKTLEDFEARCRVFENEIFDFLLKAGKDGRYAPSELIVAMTTVFSTILGRACNDLPNGRDHLDMTMVIAYAMAQHHLKD